MDGITDSMNKSLSKLQLVMDRVGDEQQSLACFSPWGGKQSVTTERLNGTDISELFSCITETNTTLQINYTSIK